tara:strand:+ start:191 stop:526 length:336 start_codon:yes stop_codon:yes gene_type:complete
VAKRTKGEIASDKIIKANLNILGEQIYKRTRTITRVLTGSLKNSVNYSVKPDTTLTFFQNAYGKDVEPAKKYSTGLNDALLITIRELLPAGIEVIKKDLTESILFPYKNRK